MCGWMGVCGHGKWEVVIRDILRLWVSVAHADAIAWVRSIVYVRLTVKYRDCIFHVNFQAGQTRYSLFDSGFILYMP